MENELLCSHCESSFDESDCQVNGRMFCPNCNSPIGYMPFTMGNGKSVSITRGDTDLRELRNYAIIVYALQAASFIFGLTAIAAIILNYVKLGDVKHTWLESHFRWQIRTFWFSLFWSIVGMVTLVFLIGFPILIATLLWSIYRIVKGWLLLSESKAMYGHIT